MPSRTPTTAATSTARGVAAAAGLVLALSLVGCGSDDEPQRPAASGSPGRGDSSGSSGERSSESAAGAEPSHDRTAVTAGASWLAAQVEDGLVHNDQYDSDDYGLSADVALTLAEVGGHDDVVGEIVQALARDVDAYVSPGFGTELSVGSAAKLAVLADTLDEEPTVFGGRDLVADVEEAVADHGPARGRAQDRLDPKQKDAADYTNVVAQAYVVTALDEADSDETTAATAYLLQQQCSDGWFRLDLAPAADARRQGCDADQHSAPDIDATAFAVRALEHSDDPAAETAVHDAAAWLLDVQAKDGSFGGPPAGQTANANSTGLAGAVLAEVADDLPGAAEAAERAAGWEVEHQLGRCTEAGSGPDDEHDQGAVAYDDRALTRAGRQGVTVKTQDQFRRATAQALPALEWLPADRASC